MLKFTNQTTQQNVTNLLEAHATAQAAGWLASHIGSMIAEIEQQAADLEPGIAEAKAAYETAQAGFEALAQEPTAADVRAALRGDLSL